ncbi:MAG: hypothetical protein ACYCX2_04810 [Christensenellales bacterium]
MGEIKSGTSQMLTNGLPKDGQLLLTDAKLEFYGKSRGVALAFGLIGSLLAKNKLQVSVDLRDIKLIIREKQALNSKILAVTDMGGQKYRFIVSGYDQWEAAVKGAARAAGASFDEVVTQ